MSEERFGPYILDRKLGAGGMAVTYLAREQLEGIGGERMVTIKQILPHYCEDPDFRNMFLDEARISTLLSHRNICRVYAAGEIEGSLYMAMEFIDGNELYDLMAVARERNVTWPTEHALFIVAEMLKGLHAAHTQTDAQGQALNLVHRDVSPQNVLISRDADVKVIDFGVAKAATNISKTATGAVKGKVLYFSPEQLKAKPLDGRSDIFAAGLMLYELLTGEHPFKGPDEHAIIFNFVTKEVEPPSTLRPDLAPEIDALVMRALAKEPQDRFGTAREMARACLDYVHVLRPGYQQHHLESYIERLFDRDADITAVAPPVSTPRLSAPQPLPVPEPTRPGQEGGGHGTLIAAVGAIALIVIAALVALVVVATGDDEDGSSGETAGEASDEQGEEEAERGAAGLAQPPTPPVVNSLHNTGSGSDQPPGVPTFDPDEDSTEDPGTAPVGNTDALMRDKLSHYQRCISRAVPRARQSYERYLTWASRSSPPTCKERYISYGLYEVYEDASQRCQSAMDHGDEPPTPELDAAMRELKQAFDVLFPVVAEAAVHFDLKEYESDCATTQALHARLLPAFEALFDAEEKVLKHFDPLWLDVERRHLAKLATSGGGELEKLVTSYAIQARLLQQTLPKSAKRPISEAQMQEFVKRHPNFKDTSRELITYTKTHSDEAREADLHWMMRSVEDLHKASTEMVKAMEKGKAPKDRTFEKALKSLAKVSETYTDAKLSR